MVLLARENALPIVGKDNCSPIVCDLATTNDLHWLIESEVGRPKGTPLVAFFGMLPNFEPGLILPRLAELMSTGALMLASANLASGFDYSAGLARILPLYDNELTRDWLFTFLSDLGVEKDDGDLRFIVEDGQRGLKRVAAYYSFNKTRKIEAYEHHFEFGPGETVRLFFSYRHTPTLLRSLLELHGLRVLSRCLTPSEEEGVFLIGSAKP